MNLTFDERPSDSPFVERIWRTHSEASAPFLSVAASHWEMVVSKYQDQTTFTVRGPETKVTPLECPAGGEWRSNTHANEFRWVAAPYLVGGCSALGCAPVQPDHSARRGIGHPARPSDGGLAAGAGDWHVALQLEVDSDRDFDGEPNMALANEQQNGQRE
jgi:hypothetical protein